MPNRFEIISEWLDVSNDANEEKSTLCSLGIKVDDLWLTQGHDLFTDSVKDAPVLSAYYLAEWFAWNWWRLRWETIRTTSDWAFSHKTGSIGHGYIWPDLEFRAEGNCIHVIARLSPQSTPNSYTYLTDFDGKIEAAHFEGVLDVFIKGVIARLEKHAIQDSNLHAIWNTVEAERSDPALSAIRKGEALIGLEPDR